MYPASSVAFNEICLQDPSWTILYCVISSIYVILYMVFAGLDIRFLKKGKVLIWFAGFCLISAFLFLSFDTAIGMYDQYDRLNYQILMLLVILIVFIHSILIFRFSMTSREEKHREIGEFEIEYGLLQLNKDAAPLPSLDHYPSEVQLRLGEREEQPEPEQKDVKPKNFVAKFLSKYFRLKQDRISMDDDVENERRVETHYYIPSEALLFLPHPKVGHHYDQGYLYGKEFKPVDRNRINDMILLQSTVQHEQTGEALSEEDAISRLSMLKKYFPG
jgi:hypothetical protein